MAAKGRFRKGQAEALAALAAGARQGEAAQAAGVHERTLRKWLAEERFAGELAGLRRVALESAALTLSLAAEESAHRLAALANDAASVAVLPPHTRLRACVAVLDAATRAHSELDLEGRIHALEEAEGRRKA
jgi:phytoene dehydrogenase-like protein